jgi:hypothetical protein
MTHAQSESLGPDLRRGDRSWTAGTFRPLPRYYEATPAKQERLMDNTTLIILIIILFFVFGGGWYGRGRWY